MLSLAYPTVGTLIVSRLPRNPIGWIFCGVGLLYAAQHFSSAYADYTLIEYSTLPAGEYAAWFSTLINLAGLGLSGVFLTLLFPDGRLLARRWRLVAWAAVFGAAMMVIAEAFMPGPLRTHTYVMNPFEAVGVIGGGLTTYEVFPALSVFGTALLLASNAGALLSLFLRLYGARGDRRQQIKWYLYAAVPTLVGMSVVFVEVGVLTFTTSFLFDPIYMTTDEVETAVNYVSLFSLSVLPVFTYIAILRHRLYDIDVVINRTLVYGALTASVVGVYVLAVGGLGALFQAQGNLGVSLLATGLVAFLFQPLRSKLQRGVNRLMYGERDDPYAVISRLGRRLEATLAPGGRAAHARRDDRPGAQAALRGDPAQGGGGLSYRCGLRLSRGRTGNPATRLPEGRDRAPGALSQGSGGEVL
jgi:hypothetical protein